MKLVTKLIEVFEDNKPINMVEIRKIEGGIPRKKLPKEYLEGYPHFFINKAGALVLFFNDHEMVTLEKRDLFDFAFFDSIIFNINEAVNRYEAIFRMKVYEWR